MELIELLKKIIEAFERFHVPYLVTGSVASMAYGEPRFTNDIDIVAAIQEDHIQGLLVEFPPAEFYINEDSIREAIRDRGQFNIIHPGSGLKVDVMIKKDAPFDNSRFKRVQRIHPSENYQANFASPEDVIIKKMEFYKEGGSEKHLRDITGILKISGDALDRKYISGWADVLGLMDIWDTIQRRLQKKQAS